MLTRGYRTQDPGALEAAMLLDTGPRREHQEDHAGIFADLDLVLVTDGMGGHSSGDHAAHMAVDAVAQGLRPWVGVPWRPEQPWSTHPLVTAIKLANLAIFEDSRVSRTRMGQGSTVAAVTRVGDGVLVAHVGDSRVHRLRAGRLERLTEDHSLLNEYRKAMPDMTPEQLAEVPRNVITRALGMMEQVEVDVRHESLEAGDLFLVCSDGLTSTLDEATIEAILARGGPLAGLARRLIDEAVRREADDNVAVVLARWDGGA